MVDGASRHRSACGPPPPPASPVSLPASGEDFGTAAARLAGLAGLLFGWPPDTFWSATPAELAALANAATGDRADPPDTIALGRLMEMFPDG